MTRRIMRTLKIDFLSAVNRPAQTPAVAVIMKSNTENKPMDELKKELAKALADLARAQKMSELTDAEKAFASKMADAEKELFLAKAASERLALVAAQKAELEKSDPVVYTSPYTGVSYFKSDDQRLVTQAKEIDAGKEELAKARIEREDAILSKRADVELAHLPGSPLAKIAILRQLDSIKDPAVRTECQNMLKAANAANAEAFVNKGQGRGTGVEGTPSDTLDKMAKTLASTANMSFAKAYRQVCSENPKLYEQAVQASA